MITIFSQKIFFIILFICFVIYLFIKKKNFIISLLFIIHRNMDDDDLFDAFDYQPSDASFQAMRKVYFYLLFTFFSLFISFFL